MDETLSLSHRVSHARSCAMLVGQKWRVPRSAVIDQVQVLCGVDLTAITQEQEVVNAMSTLDGLRESWPGNGPT